MYVSSYIVVVKCYELLLTERSARSRVGRGGTDEEGPKGHLEERPGGGSQRRWDAAEGALGWQGSEVGVERLCRIRYA